MVKLADWLTLSRVLLTPVIAAMWLSPALAWHWAGVAVFVVAGLTDVADGRIARYLNQTSRFGAYVDPLADKLLVLVTAAALVFDHRLAVWWLAVVVARELAVTTLRSVLKPGVSMPARPLAKWKTLVQLFAVGAASVLSGWVPLTLLIVSAVLTVWTGGEYIRDYWPHIEV